MFEMTSINSILLITFLDSSIVQARILWNIKLFQMNEIWYAMRNNISLHE